MAIKRNAKSGSRKRRKQPPRDAKPRGARRRLSRRLNEPDSRVRIRMYRPGLGECFLLTFPRLGVPFHMLVDCGAFPRPGTGGTIRKIAQDIDRTTGGRLDVLVVTHRHWDHISGFFQASDVFKGMSVEQVWMGWTENPDDAEARRLGQRRKGMMQIGPGVSRSQQTMEMVRGLGRVAWYWRGGQGPVALSGVSGARVFFLGPPTPRANLAEAMRAASARTRAAECPFEPRDRVSMDEARDDPRFARYFGRDGTDHQDPEDRDVVWRQIGQPTERRVPPIRLDQPQEINNTSLVMAIELISPRGDSRVLLFPGDAQLASWLSWHEHRWPPDAPDAMTCATLLQRTVVYKASQRGSELGTPKQYGLEMMTSPELVALLSVDEGEAEKRRWIMPAPAVLEALARATRGRVIRSDTGVPERAGPRSDPAEWEEFRRAIDVADLYIDYHVEIPQVTVGEREKSESNWSAANERRVYLVDKKLAGSIRPEEEAELREIERLLDEYMSLTAPTASGLLAELRESVERARRSGA